MSGSYLHQRGGVSYFACMPPAARITDMHVCPMVTGIVPHVGGPILPPCAVDVLIGGLPAARVGDMLTCVGPPDVIVKGSPTVLINNRPAARMLDQTAHGGLIVLGCFTVIIGDGGGGGGSVSGGGMGAPDVNPTALAEDKNPSGADSTKPVSSAVSYGKAITIEGDDAFKTKTIAALDELKKTPTGAALLADIEKSGKKVTIKPTTGGNEVGGLSDGAFVKGDGSPGSGSNSTVYFNPDKTTVGSGKDGWQTRPPAIGLGHELVHADHAARGTIDMTPIDNDSKPDPKDTTKTAKAPREEVTTAGIPPNDSGTFTENKLRSEWNPKQPPRPWY